MQARTPTHWQKEHCFENPNLSLRYPAELGKTDSVSSEIRDEQDNLVSFAALPPAEKMRYHIFSVVCYGVSDRFGWLSPRKPFFAVFQKKEDFVVLAKALEKQGHLKRHKGLFKFMLLERPDCLAHLLSGMSDKAADKIIEMLKIDFYVLHPKHELHQQAKQLLAGMPKGLDRLHDREEQFKKCRKELGIQSEELPIPYVELLKHADKVKPDTQFIFQLYLRQYFSAVYRQHQSKDKSPNYAALFKKAHENFIQSQDERMQFLCGLVFSGQLERWVREDKKQEITELDITLKELARLLPLFDLLQQQDCLDDSFRRLMKFRWSSPSRWAVKCKQDENEIRKLLVEEGVKENSHTALRIAISHGRLRKVYSLIESGVNVQAVDLFNAIRDGRSSMVRLLLESGVSINALYDTLKATSLYIAAHCNHLSTAHLLLRHGADVNIATKEGVTPLYVAAQNGNVKMMGLLINYGADVNSVTHAKKGATPLFIASQKSYVKAVKLLLQQPTIKVDVVANGVTALYIAAEKGHEKVVHLLLQQKGSNVDADKSGCPGLNALYVAVREGHEKVVRMLIDVGGANVNKTTRGGKTPLFLAAKNGSEKIVCLLLNAGAIPDFNSFHAAKIPEIKKILLTAILTQELAKARSQYAMAEAKESTQSSPSRFFTRSQKHFAAMEQLIANLEGKESCGLSIIAKELQGTPWKRHCETVELLGEEIVRCQHIKDVQAHRVKLRSFSF